jgi:O-antigen/teichoic acid export membrane protein
LFLRLTRVLKAGGSSGELFVRAGRTLVVNALGVGLGFALHFVFARQLGVSEYGLYIYIVTWVTVLSLLCVLGYDAASLKFVAEHRARAEHGAVWGFLDFARRRALLMSLCVALLLGVFAEALQATTGAPGFVAYVVGVLLLPCTVLLNLYGYFLQGLKRADEAQTLQLIVRPVLLIAGCMLLTWYLPPPDAFDALMVTLLVTVFVAGLEAWRVRHLAGTGPAPVESDAHQKRWTSTASSLLLITVGQQVLANGDILLVGLLLGTTDAGVYAVAAKLAVVVSFATSSINLILAPAIADFHARGRREELQAAVTTATNAAVLYAVPVLAIMVIGGGWLLSQFGEGFERGRWVLIILCLGQAAVTLNGAVGFLLTMTGHHGTALRVISLSAALMVVMALLFGRLWGITGVAGATALALALRSLLLGYCARKHLGIVATPRWPSRKAALTLRVKNYLKHRYPERYRVLRTGIDPVLRELRFLSRVGVGVVLRHFFKPPAWREMLPLQTVLALDIPTLSAPDLVALRKVASALGPSYSEGGHTLYLPPASLDIMGLKSVALRYPCDAGLKFLKTPDQAGEGTYLHTSYSVLHRAVTYTPAGLILNANILHLHGLGPRLYDLVELRCDETRWLAYIVADCSGRAPTMRECEDGIARIRALQDDGLLRVTATGGIEDPDFACPDCSGNAFVPDDTVGFQYVDFQNFVLENYERFLTRLAQEAASDSHFGDTTLFRSGRYLYQSVPGTRLPAKRDTLQRSRVIDDLLQRAGVSVTDRLVLEFGCNIGMMMGQYLKRGARWCHGWDMPAIVPHAEKLLLATGCTRFSLTPAILRGDLDVFTDLPLHVRNGIEGCAVSYLAMTKHIGWLRELARIPWHIMIVEGHEGEDDAAFDATLGQLRTQATFWCAAKTRYRDGDCDPRCIAILVREARSPARPRVPVDEDIIPFSMHDG